MLGSAPSRSSTRAERFWPCVVRPRRRLHRRSVAWALVGFVVQQPASRQASFLGEHDLAALSTVALVVGLAASSTRDRRRRQVALAGIVAARSGSRSARRSRACSGSTSHACALIAVAPRHGGASAAGPSSSPSLVCVAVTAGTYGLRSADLGFLRPWFAPRRRTPARPVRRQLEPAADLLVHRRPHLRRPPGARNRLVGRAAAARVRAVPPRRARALLRISRRGTSLRRGARSSRSRRTTRCSTSSGLVGVARLRRAVCLAVVARWSPAARPGPGRADERAAVPPGGLAGRARRRARRRGAVRRHADGGALLAHLGSSDVARRAPADASAEAAAERELLSIVHAIARLNVGGAALHVLELAAEQSPARPRRRRRRRHARRGRGVDGVRRRRARRRGRASAGAAARALAPRRPGRDPRAAADHPAAAPGRPPHAHRQGRRDRPARRDVSPAAPARGRSSTPTTATSSAATSPRAGSGSSSRVERALARHVREH